MGSPATSKNVLTVGASENNRSTITSEWGAWWPSDFPQDPINSDKMANHSEGMAGFSSRGPVDDGRLKPDVSAPGTFILSTKSRQTTDTGWLAHSEFGLHTYGWNKHGYADYCRRICSSLSAPNR